MLKVFLVLNRAHRISDILFESVNGQLMYCQFLPFFKHIFSYFHQHLTRDFSQAFSPNWNCLIKLPLSIISPDIDECNSGRACSNIPNAECENRPGDYRCVCKEGYQRSALGCEGMGSAFCSAFISLWRYRYKICRGGCGINSIL